MNNCLEQELATARGVNLAGKDIDNRKSHTFGLEHDLVLNKAREQFPFINTYNKNSIDFCDFIDWELKQHPEYDIKKNYGNGKPNMRYLDLLADKLHLFAILTGKHMLKQDFPLKNTYITPDNPLSLNFLTSKGNDRMFWSSKELFEIYIRRRDALKFAKNEGVDGFGTYKFHLKEVLEAPAVIDLFGELIYEKNISTKGIKNNIHFLGLGLKVPPIRGYVGPFDPTSLSYERLSRGRYTGKYS